MQGISLLNKPFLILLIIINLFLVTKNDCLIIVYYRDLVLRLRILENNVISKIILFYKDCICLTLIVIKVSERKKKL